MNDYLHTYKKMRTFAHLFDILYTCYSFLL